MRISASSLKTYLQCPLKYKYHYVQQLGNVYKQNNIKATYSNLIHQSLFKILENEWSEKPKYIRKVITVLAVQFGITDREIIEKGNNAINDYLNKSNSFGKVYRNNETVKVKWAGYDFYVMIDRIDIDDDLLTIVDYKTGTYFPSDIELQNDIQLGLYRILVEEKFKKAVKSVVWQNLTIGKELIIKREELPSNEKIKEIVKKVNNKLIYSKKNGFSHNSGSHCRFCDFKVICPYIEDELKNVVNDDPILGELYQLNGIIRDLSGVLNTEKLIKNITTNFKILSNCSDAKLILLDKTKNIKKKIDGEDKYLINNGIEDIAVLKVYNMPNLSLKKEAIIESFLSQAGIFLNNAILYHKANTDRMTDFYHQTYLKNYIGDLIKNNDKFSMIIFDLDKFKNVNDAYGHQTGDIVLIGYADILRKNTRLSTGDIISRYGGEEFAVLMKNVSKKMMFTVAERVRKELEKTTFYSIDDKKINITVSGGVVSYPNDGKNKIDLIENCDKALYRAKTNGKNQINIYTKEK
jgi:diguanylate cyclase (GGDEF)-like protein